MEMSAFCNLYALENAIMFNDAYDRNVVHFDSVVANFRYARDTPRSLYEPLSALCLAAIKCTTTRA